MFEDQTQFESGEQLNAMYEKAKSALEEKVIEKIKSASLDEAKAVLGDLLVFDRTAILSTESDDEVALETWQEQIDEIAEKHGLEKGFLSLKEYRELAKKI